MYPTNYIGHTMRNEKKGWDKVRIDSWLERREKKPHTRVPLQSPKACESKYTILGCIT